ncbi:MAG: mshB3, partial [Chloroflexi bacterium]|nr:mshB3 [Chloroflexota bacterium]
YRGPGFTDQLEENNVQERARRRVLAVYAHPDDAEIWAGGTLLAHRELGDHTAVCVMTHGDTARHAEAKHGARLLDATLHHLSFQDRALALANGAVEALAEVLRRERPHIILTHWSADSHPDHRATWEITRAAILLAEAERELAGLFWSDTYNSLGESGLFAADSFINVSDMWKAKLAAIMAHESQHPADYCAMTSNQCALLGAGCGVRYAEGFRRVPFIGRGHRAAATLNEFC